MRSDAGSFLLTSSRAGYQAMDPFGDTTLLEVDGKHAFSVVMNADFTARGASYLSRNLLREVRSQIQAYSGNLAQAFLSAISVLDKNFRRIHPFNGPVLEGVRIAAAYIDVPTNAVHLASNGGGARAILASTQANNSLSVVASIGSDEQASSDPAACRIQQLRLDAAADIIIVGSPGLWRELSPDNAALRMEHYHMISPAANACNAAAHLNNHALQAVTRRVGRSVDPRMRSLTSVQHLQSLWVGDRSNVKMGYRQPVRRRRGDVHGDLSAVVMHLQWQGKEQNAMKAAACRLKHSMSTPMVDAIRPQRPSAAARWVHLRMHFLDFPRAARQQVQEKWQQTVHAAVQHGKTKTGKGDNKAFRPIMIRASSRDLDRKSGSIVTVSA